MVGAEKGPQGCEIRNGLHAHGIRQSIQRRQTVRRAKLLDERMRIAQPFSGVLSKLRLRPTIHFRFQKS